MKFIEELPRRYGARRDLVLWHKVCLTIDSEIFVREVALNDQPAQNGGVSLCLKLGTSYSLICAGLEALKLSAVYTSMIANPY